MPRIKAQQDNRLYCICKQLKDVGQLMIQCDGCEEWFHPHCVQLSDDDAIQMEHLQESYFCISCMEFYSSDPLLNKNSFTGLHGRVSPKLGWSSETVLEEFPLSIIQDYLKSSRMNTHGYRLWNANRVTLCESNKMLSYLYYRALVEASMKRIAYHLVICIDLVPMGIKWSHCQCIAGIDGDCKHVIATCYYIQHHVLCGDSSFTCVVAPTQLPQVWHMKKPTNDEPVIFTDLEIKKYTPGSIISRKRKSEKQSAVASYIKNIRLADYANKESLEAFANSLAHLEFPILETWRSHEYCPVLPKEVQDDGIAKDLFELMSLAEYSFDYSEIYNAEIGNSHLYFKNEVTVSLEEAIHIEQSTRMQSRSITWRNVRSRLLTSSNFRRFVKMRVSTDAAKVHKYLNTNVPRSDPLSHGLKYESVAIQKFLKTDRIFENCQHSPVGLCIQPALPYLGSSPDYCLRLDNSLCFIEVKCPYSLYRTNMKIRDAAKGKNFYLTYDSNGTLGINRDSPAFYQIQGQLNICNVMSAYLVVFVPPNDLEYCKVDKDAQFFNSILPILSEIYFKKVLPAISTSYL